MQVNHHGVVNKYKVRISSTYFYIFLQSNIVLAVNVCIHDFDDVKEESNKAASKDKHCFEINTRLLQQTKSCFKISSRSSLTSKQRVSKSSKALVITYQAV